MSSMWSSLLGPHCTDEYALGPFVRPSRSANTWPSAKSCRQCEIKVLCSTGTSWCITAYFVSNKSGTVFTLPECDRKKAGMRRLIRFTGCCHFGGWAADIFRGMQRAVFIVATANIAMSRREGITRKSGREAERGA